MVDKYLRHFLQAQVLPPSFNTARALQTTVWWLLKKLNIELPHDTEISLLGVYTKELKAGTCTSIFTALFTKAERGDST